MTQPAIAYTAAQALREYLRTDAPEALENEECSQDEIDALTALADRLEAAQDWSRALDADLCEAFQILSAY